METEENEHLHTLCDRVTELELKVDRLIAIFERGTGAWGLIKVLGTCALGLTVIWAFLMDHITFK